MPRLGNPLVIQQDIKIWTSMTAVGLSSSFTYSLNIHCGSAFVPVTGTYSRLKKKWRYAQGTPVLPWLTTQQERSELLKYNIKRIVVVEMHAVMGGLGGQGVSPPTQRFCSVNFLHQSFHNLILTQRWVMKKIPPTTDTVLRGGGTGPHITSWFMKYSTGKVTLKVPF